MSIFNEYSEGIKLSGWSEPLDVEAYRFDHTGPEGNFRKDAGVGTCNCCDYFTFDRCGDLILIEDTQLNATIKNKKAEIKDGRSDLKFLKRASKKKKTQYIVNHIKIENVVKVYGSLFVFYKFLNKKLICQSIESFTFWLIAVDVGPKEIEALEHYKREIRSDLRSKLGREFVKDVELIPGNKLRDKLISVQSACGS